MALPDDSTACLSLNARRADHYADGLVSPEGPVVLPDGSLICVEVLAGRLTQVSPSGQKGGVAELGGVTRLRAGSSVSKDWDSPGLPLHFDSSVRRRAGGAH